MRRTPVVDIRRVWQGAGEERGGPEGRGPALLPSCALLLLALGAFLGVLLLGDVALAALLEGGGALGVELGEAGPLGGDVGLGEDGLDRALGDAGLAVDAVRRVDVQHLLVLVE